MKNIRLDVNGSDDKIYPQEENFNFNVDSTQPVGMGDYVPQTDHDNVANTFGQIKYARREGAISIYKDETRATDNDAKASAKAEGSCVGDVNDSSYDEAAEESQGI